MYTKLQRSVPSLAFIYIHTIFPTSIMRARQSTSLVRPTILEYDSVIWDQQTAWNSIVLERV